MSTKKLDSVQIAKLVANAGKDFLENKVLVELIGRIRDLLPDEEEKEEKPPAVKKQYVVLVSDPLGQMPVESLAGWVFQIREEDAPQSIEERIQKAAYDFNEGKIGSKAPVQTISEAVESIKSGKFKDVGVWVKTRVPVLIGRTSNEIPKTGGVLDDNRGGPKGGAL